VIARIRPGDLPRHLLGPHADVLIRKHDARLAQIADAMRVFDAAAQSVIAQIKEKPKWPAP